MFWMGTLVLSNTSKLFCDSSFRELSMRNYKLFQHIAVFFTLLVGCSNDTQPHGEWRLEETDLGGDLNTFRDQNQTQGCVYEGDFRVGTQEDVQELANFPCAEITGFLAIYANDDVTSISSIGNLRKVHRDVSFGSGEYLDITNKSLKNIEGFQSLKYIGEGLAFYDAPVLFSLDDFYNLDYLTGISVYNDAAYGDVVAIPCSEVDALDQHMRSRTDEFLGSTCYE